MNANDSCLDASTSGYSIVHRCYFQCQCALRSVNLWNWIINNAWTINFFPSLRFSSLITFELLINRKLSIAQSLVNLIVCTYQIRISHLEQRQVFRLALEPVTVVMVVVVATGMPLWIHDGIDATMNDDANLKPILVVVWRLWCCWEWAVALTMMELMMRIFSSYFDEHSHHQLMHANRAFDSATSEWMHDEMFDFSMHKWLDSCPSLPLPSWTPLYNKLASCSQQNGIFANKPPQNMATNKL